MLILLPTRSMSCHQPNDLKNFALPLVTVPLSDPIYVVASAVVAIKQLANTMNSSRRHMWNSPLENGSHYAQINKGESFLLVRDWQIRLKKREGYGLHAHSLRRCIV